MSIALYCEKEISEEYMDKKEKKEKIIIYDVKGMTCAACVTAVEKNALKSTGVQEANVSLSTQQIRVVVDESYDEKILFRNIQLSGYTASVQDKEVSLFEKQTKILKDLRLKIIISAFFLVFLMYISMGHMVGLPLPDFIDPDINPFGFALSQLLFTVPIMIVGYKYYVNGFKNMLRKQPNMDSLIAVGTLASFFYGVFGLIMIYLGNHEYAKMLYFESSGVILVLVMVGKFMEQKSSVRTTSELEKLMDLKPNTGLVYKDKKYIEMPIEEIKIGDYLLIRPGDVVTTDGIIIEGETAINESMMTGEPLPVDKSIKDVVIGGTINITGSILIEATHVGEETVLANIIERVSEAQMKKAPIQRLVDKISGIFVPTVFIIAIISFIFWMIYMRDFNFAINIFVSILVIACPCALGLATPTAIMTASGVAAKHGLLISSGDALEISGKVTLVAFDKTGTITKGKPAVVDVVSASKVSENELLQIAASLEQHSSHPIGQALIKEASTRELKLQELADFENFTGFGIKGTINNEIYYIGNKKLMDREKVSLGQTITITSEYANTGKTPLYLAKGKELLGIISIADELKAGVKEVIDRLHEKGIKTAILSGDEVKTVEYIQKKLNIDYAYGSLLPEDKQRIIKELKETEIVLMIGDGINDAIALKEANIGVGLSSGTDIAMSAGDVVLMKDDLFGLINLIDLSNKTIKNIKGNLFWAFAYNIIGIPIAMGVLTFFGGPLLNPMFAALAMSLSSVSVVLNALRLKRYKGAKR